MLASIPSRHIVSRLTLLHLSALLIAACSDDPSGPGWPALRLALRAVAPDSLVEGAVATLTGSGFSRVPGDNHVTVDGAPALITAATPTSLTITVPHAACRPARDVEVRVTMGDASSDAVRHPLRSAAYVDLPVGQQLIVRDPADFCLHFAESAAAEAYLVGVQSVAELVTSVTPVTVAGVAAPSAVAAAPLPPPARAMRFGAGIVGEEPVESPQEARLRRHFAAEAELRRLEELRSAELGRAGDTLAPSLARSRAASAVPATARVGDRVSISVPDFYKNRFVSVTAVVRHIGRRGIWLEDVGNPAGGFTAADYQSMSDQFDGPIYDTDVEYFGEPTDLDGNGHIVILVTKEINTFNNPADPAFNLLAFVCGCDLQPDQSPGANGGEFFYSMAPDPAGALGRTYSTEQARTDMPWVLAHEFTHILQNGHRRTASGAVRPRVTWQSEGQATLAVEVVAHRLFGRRPGQNYGYEAMSRDAPGRPWYSPAFSDLVEYFGWESRTTKIEGAPEQCSWLARVDDGNTGPCLDSSRLPYGVGWSFLRWLSDQFGPSYPGGEQALQRALNENRAPGVGFPTVSAVVGVPKDSLLAQWAAMLYVDDRVAGAARRLTMPSWNLADIMPHFGEAGPLAPRERAFATFSDDVKVRGASTAYFRLSGAGRTETALGASTPARTPLAPHMRLWVVRLQ